MKFLGLSMRDGFYSGKYDFQDVNVVYSKANKQGKTTLLRCLLYSLGYPIPATRGFSIDSITFTLTIETDGGEVLILNRSNNFLQLQSGINTFDYSLPGDQDKLHQKIFGVGNKMIVENLLGAFYFDQEKGWTLLNRGVVIGSIHFSIEDLFCGLADKPCINERERLRVVEREIRKCSQMLSLADYQESLLSEGEMQADYELSRDDETRIEIERLKNLKQTLASELNRLRKARGSCSDFEKFIESIQISVLSPSGEEIAVTSSNVVGLKDHSQLLLAKHNEVRFRLSDIENRISTLEARLSKDRLMFEMESDLKRFDKELLKIKIDRKSTQSRLNALRRQKNELYEIIRKSIASSGVMLQRFHELVNSYVKELGLGENFIKDIFTHNLKELTGAIFHLVVFAFKISYVRLIYEKTGCRLPLIIDSPNGREVARDNVARTYDILMRDFKDHQIIMATIFMPNMPHLSIIEMNGRVMPDGMN